MQLFRSDRNQPEASADDLARIFESESSEVRAGPGPVSTRRTVLYTAALFIILMTIAGSFQLDRVISSTFGQVVTVEPTVVMQPLDLSIIKTINIHEGERVKKGQLLATLDPTIAASGVDALKLQIASLSAEIARCEAELAGKPYDFVPGNGMGEAQYAALQRSYFEQRKAQYDAQLKSFDSQIAGYKAQIVELKNDEARYGDRVKLNAAIEDIRATLARSYNDSKLNWLQASDQKVEMQRNLEADENNVAVNEQQIDTVTANRKAYIEQWRAQTSQELVNARNQRDSAQQQLQAALKHLEVVRLDAPHSAIVLRLAKLSVGSVLQPGDNFIELALLRSPIEAEIYIDPIYIGFVRPGDDVTIKVDAFNYLEHGWAEGKVRWISEGTFTTTPGSSSTGGSIAPVGTSPGTSAVPTTSNGVSSSTSNSTSAPQTNNPLYKARVTITKMNLRGVPKDARLLPGMTLTADIHDGTQSVFYYVFSGFLRTFNQAMREP